MSSKNYYELLGISSVNVTNDKVKKAFMTKALLWHPDKAKDEKEVAIFTKMYENLQKAYKILSTEESRKQYSDAQQSTSVELINEIRDRSYQRSEEYAIATPVGYTFDRDTFNKDFNRGREAITEEDKPISLTSSLEQLIKKREEDITTSTSTQIFNQEEYNGTLFNLVFEHVKATQTQPKSHNQGLAVYEAPLSSGSGLAEIDVYSMDILSNTNGGELNMHMVYNPVNIDLNEFKKTIKDNSPPPAPHPAVDVAEDLKKVEDIQRERAMLLEMDKSTYSTEPTEIEKLYAELYSSLKH